MFILQKNKINVEKFSSYTNTAIGAFVSFEGLVRADTHDQSHVRSLHYFADEEFCRNEGLLILEEALKCHQLNRAICIQRIGPIPVGEQAIWIGVWSGRRENAFNGCRFIIEAIKKRLRIWKKESLDNGQSFWVHGQETIHL